MPITIENPTAEAVWQAVLQLPQTEVERLKQMFAASHEETAAQEQEAWHEVSAQSATRFFDEEDTS